MMAWKSLGTTENCNNKIYVDRRLKRIKESSKQKIGDKSIFFLPKIIDSVIIESILRIPNTPTGLTLFVWRCFDFSSVL
jgi:hypothetical protein